MTQFMRMGIMCSITVKNIAESQAVYAVKNDFCHSGQEGLGV